jgi:PKHD-type hydroxylase
MKLNYTYWYFQKALSEKFCDDVISFAKEKQTKLAMVGDYEGLEKLNKKEIKDLKKVRDSNIVFLNEPWIAREFMGFAHEANKRAGWNFDFDSYESIQFTKYKKNQFYGWHQDSFKGPRVSKNKMLDGKIRKISMTFSLSDPKKYKGGELEFETGYSLPTQPGKKQNVLKCKEILPRGSMVFFPSFVWHKVNPVTQGTRYSLVIWFNGKPFR